MRAHSIENKPSREIRNSNGATPNIDSLQGFYSKLPVDSHINLRRCESSSGLAKRSNRQLGNLKSKYCALEEDYRKILKDVRYKGELYIRQKQKVEKLHEAVLKDEKQICRLKQMLRMVSRLDSATQTENSRYSHLQTLKKSDDLELTSETRDEKRTSRKSTGDKFKGYNMNEQWKVKAGMSPNDGVLKQSDRQKAPLTKKYKFVPSLTFKHL